MPCREKPHSKGSPTQKTKATFLYAPGRSILTARMRPPNLAIGAAQQASHFPRQQRQSAAFRKKEEGEKGLRKPKRKGL